MSYIYEKILLPFDYEETPVPRLQLWAFLVLYFGKVKKCRYENITKTFMYIITLPTVCFLCFSAVAPFLAFFIFRKRLLIKGLRFTGVLVF